MLFVMLVSACFSDLVADIDCSSVDCSCAIGTGTLLVEDVPEASLRILHLSEKDKEQTIVCSPSPDGALCEFTPASSHVYVEIQLENTSYPLEIQAIERKEDNCCACSHYDFVPHSIHIQYQ